MPCVRRGLRRRMGSSESRRADAPLPLKMALWPMTDEELTTLDGNRLMLLRDDPAE